MDGQETLLSEKKRRGPAPTGQGVLIGVRLHPNHLAALDAYIAVQPLPAPSRPEAIRNILRKHLGA